MQQSCVMDHCFFRKQIRPKEEARISFASHSLHYGSTCFGGIRGYVRNGKARVFRLRCHHERLMEASKILGFGFNMPYEDFEQIIAGLIEANRPTCDFYIRPFLFTENEGIGVAFDNHEFDLGVYMLPMNSYYPPDKGLKLMISSWLKNSDSAIPTKAKAGGGYVNSSMATMDARRAGYDDALMMDHNQNIVEASVANLFLVRRGEVITPPLGSDILEGVTMRTVIDLLKEQGYTVRHEPISRSMVYTCDELFLTGTAAGVIFVESVDGRTLGAEGKEGPVANKMKKTFMELIEMKHPRSKEWVSEFYVSEVCHEACAHI